MSWNPGADGVVYALALSGSMVYLGGDFTYIAGELRNNIAALDASTGQATAWNPVADYSVYALAVSSSTVYAEAFSRASEASGGTVLRRSMSGAER